MKAPLVLSDVITLSEQFAQLVADLREANAADVEAREARVTATFIYRQDRSTYLLIDEHAKEAVRNLQRCKDNLCNFFLEHQGLRVYDQHD